MKSPMWNLAQATDAIRELQFKALQCGYHLALGGGVLNKGASYNDLDVIVLPLGGQTARREKFLDALEGNLGASTLLGASAAEENVGDVHRYRHEGRVIDFLFYRR